MHKRILWLLLVLVQQFSFAQIPFFKDLQVSPELVDLKINSIYQDQNHFLWVGTSKGAYRYDGYSFFLVPASDIVSNPSVNAMFRDSAGRLWIGYADGSIYNYYNNVFSSFKFDEGFPKVAITSFTSDSAGNIWFGTYGEGVYVYSRNHLYNFNKDDGLPDNFVYCITLNGKDELWCGTDEGIGICKWSNQKKTIKKLSQADGLPDNIVKYIRASTDGKMWIGMHDKGVCEFDLSSNKFLIPENLVDWKYGEVTCICLLHNDEMWVGTEKSGIVDVELFGSNRVRSFDRNNGLPSNKISKLLLDVEGNIWIASGNKIVFSPGEKLEFLKSIGGFAVNDIQAVLRRSNDELWISTPTDIWKINLNNDGIPLAKKVFEKNELGAASILSMYEDENNNVWLGTFGQGVFYYQTKSKKLTQIREANGLANDNVLSINGKGNEIWFATLGGASRCALNKNEGTPSFQTFTSENGLGEDYVYDVFIDSKNRVWFATDGRGITMYNDSAFVKYGTEVGLKSSVIYSIAEDSHGTLWFSTLNAGIYSFDGKIFKNYSLKEGLSRLDISSIKGDDNGNLIIVHNNGIDVLETKTKKIIYFSYESGIGEIDPNLNAANKDKNGNIWIGTKTGVIKIHMPSGRLKTHPKTVINNVKLFLQDYDLIKKSVFNHDQNHISFDYVGLFYGNPDKVTYEYKLAGYNNDWVHTNDRFITFPSLPPGNYKFELRSAIDNNYRDAKIVSYSFTIQKPYWEAAWFFVAIILSIVGSLYFLVRVREQNYKRTEKQKKERIEFQFETLKAQINPHFLFNSFNTLATLIEEDQKIAVKYVDKLSDFYRSILSYKDVDLISLKEEWELCMNYIYLLKQRHGESLKFIEGDFEKRDDLLIPPLSLQILIENAVKHNIISRERPLTVHIYMLDENNLVIENNLQLKSIEPPSTKIGLGSISERLILSGGTPLKAFTTENKFKVQITLINKKPNT